ncbi:MAG TPA: hypothetical protein VF435_14130 [Pyrinomonadaceae bacterium]
MTALWALLLALAVIILIYLEKTAILYILCTLGVAGLLIVVAFSDLAQREPKTDVGQEPGAAGVAGRER